MDPNAYEALWQRAAYIDLTGRGKLRAVGEDSARLLHAMCTNNIQELMPGSGCYAFFLSSQGRILADANIFCMPDYLLLDTEAGTKQHIQDHLEKYIIADDVTLADFTPTTSTINIEGAQAEQIMAEMGGPATHVPWAFAEWGHKQVAHTNYTGAPGYSIFVPDTETEGFVKELKKFGLSEADHSTVEVVRIENGHPRFGVDFSDANIPQETPLMDAVHFSKGCYLGQEIVERVRSRGHVNRTLTPIQLESSDVPEKGAKVQDNGKDVGEITSAAYSPRGGRTVGLAMLRVDAQGSSALTVNGAPVTVVKRPAPQS